MCSCYYRFINGIQFDTCLWSLFLRLFSPDALSPSVSLPPSLSSSSSGHVPKLHPSRHAIFGTFRFSEKSWTYVFALQLLLGDGLSSVAAATSGLLAGTIYLVDIFGLQKFRLPKIVEVGRHLISLLYLFLRTQTDDLLSLLLPPWLQSSCEQLHPQPTHPTSSETTCSWRRRDGVARCTPRRI
jgi:hypothetical protein